ncbi:unnamed protein product [Moneuplotes crassus]|uniref:Uncharacterized protein n=2 Tax=Euplotes crassus TaxID=5936 RepID=A0AAD1Y9S3_EUPCR|nr:unnamed protein product [Moneuplotes crassus]
MSIFNQGNQTDFDIWDSNGEEDHPNVFPGMIAGDQKKVKNSRSIQAIKIKTMVPSVKEKSKKKGRNYNTSFIPIKPTVYSDIGLDVTRTAEDVSRKISLHNQFMRMKTNITGNMSSLFHKNPTFQKRVRKINRKSRFSSTFFRPRNMKTKSLSDLQGSGGNKEIIQQNCEAPEEITKTVPINKEKKTKLTIHLRERAEESSACGSNHPTDYSGDSTKHRNKSLESADLQKPFMNSLTTVMNFINKRKRKSLFEDGINDDLKIANPVYYKSKQESGLECFDPANNSNLFFKSIYPSSHTYKLNFNFAKSKRKIALRPEALSQVKVMKLRKIMRERLGMGRKKKRRESSLGVTGKRLK